MIRKRTIYLLSLYDENEITEHSQQVYSQLKVHYRFHRQQWKMEKMFEILAICTGVFVDY
jgi:hypothetical protein